MKVASTLTDIVASGQIYDDTTSDSLVEPQGLSLEELAMVHGGSGGKGGGLTGLVNAAGEILTDAGKRVIGPTADEAGNRLRDWVFSEDPAPPPPQPEVYQEPIMSGEANMSLNGGGVGQDGVPVDDGGSHHYVWLPPEVNSSSADGNPTGY